MGTERRPEPTFAEIFERVQHRQPQDDFLHVGRERVDVPPIEVEVRDAEGQPLYRWSVPGPRSALEPGERARFKASLSAPPEKGRQIEVRFADKPAGEGAGPGEH